MNSSRRNFWLATFGLLWLTLVVSSYYWSHKPVSIDIALSLGKAVFQILVGSAVVFISGGLGGYLLRGQKALNVYNPSLSAAFGLGIVSLLLFLLGGVFGFNVYLAWIFMVGMIVLLRNWILQWWQQISEIVDLWKESSNFGIAIGLGCILILTSSLLVALAPPLKYDALVYHLSLPRIYLDAGKIVYIPENMFWGMPQVNEMLFMWAISLAGVETATVLGWVIGVLALIGIIDYSYRQLGSVNAAWVVVASLLSGYTTAASLAWGYVDWTTILFGFGFLVTLNKWRSDIQDNDLFLGLSGVFAGFALGTKYTAGILAVIGVIIVIVTTYRKSLLRLFNSILLFIVPVILFTLPWWIKNTIATGNPFYPFLFPAGAMSELRLNLYTQGEYWGGWLDLLILPVRATIYGVEGAPGYSASIGPLLLGLGGMAWVNKHKNTKEENLLLGSAALITLIGIFIWILASRFSHFLLQSRLYYSLLPAAGILAGVGFLGLDRFKFTNLRIGRIAGALIILVFWLNVIQIGITNLEKGSSRVVAGITTPDSYLSDNLGWYAPVMQSLNELGSEARILTLWEPRNLYCEPSICVPDEILDRWLVDLSTYGSVDAILKSWDQEYTHVLVYRSGVNFLKEQETSKNGQARYLPEDWLALDRLLNRLPSLEKFGQAYELYVLAQ